jgi:pimeloyl-ACP methyl ester carboxylesterase
MFAAVVVVVVVAEFENAYTAQAFVLWAPDAEVVVVAFRGTPAFDTARWRADMDPSWYKVPRLGRAHAAYMHALGAQRNMGWPKWVEHVKGKPNKVYAYYAIRDAVKELLEANGKARLLVTGHGSGGALAVLFATVLAYHREKAVLDRLAGVYTFGQPRVGDAMLAMFAERHLDRPKKRHFRFAYAGDPQPRLPAGESSPAHFMHFGLCLHFDVSYNLKVIIGEFTALTFWNLFSFLCGANSPFRRCVKNPEQASGESDLSFISYAKICQV